MSIHLAYILLMAVGALVAVPVTVLFVECIAALVAREPRIATGLSRPSKVAVLISAHNEELLIQSTVRSLHSQLQPGDQLVVVADNCNDRTAELARAAGATVVERCDPTKRGKGYGLAHGVEFLRKSPPEMVIVFDADCAIQAGVVDRLASEAWEINRPVQARYLLASPSSAGARGIISTLAFTVKNAVRPAGLAALGIPCALNGTGMAFPWPLIEKAPLASGHLVEDMELGLHFMRIGHGPKLCTAVTITGHMPSDMCAAFQQRTRWEHGHLMVIFSRALPLLIEGLIRRRRSLIAMGLDLTVPPLALLAMVWAAGGAASAALGLISRHWTPAILFGATGAMLTLSVIAAQRRYARHLPLLALFSVPFYVAWKIPLYLGFVFKRETNWIRTARDAAPKAVAPATTTKG